MTAAFADHRTEGDVDDDHPFIGRVQRYADTVLAPSALHTDRHGVPADRVADLSDLGLLNHLAPSAFGGAAIGRATDRRIHEILSEACLNTWLVWTQHAPVVARVAKAAASDRITGPLVMEILSGRLLLGAALSDVRGYPDRHVSARPTSGGWILSGTVSWVSGWGAEFCPARLRRPCSDRTRGDRDRARQRSYDGVAVGSARRARQSY
ncbi:acyl-CoA dehydrogenase family protein [Gordonia humi]|uniref:acyl-CoA dehydrogenase family protein n=1 Tax=Gordonia humi TaxID=686429 RepID=UPI00360C5E6B